MKRLTLLVIGLSVFALIGLLIVKTCEPSTIHEDKVLLSGDLQIVYREANGHATTPTVQELYWGTPERGMVGTPLLRGYNLGKLDVQRISKDVLRVTYSGGKILSFYNSARLDDQTEVEVVLVRRGLTSP